MLFKFNLFMHDGEGGDAGAGSAETGEGVNTEFDTNNTEAVAEPETEVSEVDKAKEYAELKSKYKNEFNNDVQKLINRRFAKAKETETKLAEQNEVISLLHQRYGTKSISSLMEALESDEAYLEKRAEELDMTVEQARLYDKIQRENAILKANQEAYEAERQKDEQIGKWMQEATVLQEKYPEFDLLQELESDAFKAQLMSGVPLELAYKTAHFDELMQSTTAYTAQQTEKKVTANIRAKGNRPIENGASKKSAFSTGIDISKFSKEQIEEIGKRVAKGEKITFR